MGLCYLIVVAKIMIIYENKCKKRKKVNENKKIALPLHPK